MRDFVVELRQQLTPGGQEPDRPRDPATARSRSCSGRTASSPRTGGATPAARASSRPDEPDGRHRGRRGPWPSPTTRPTVERYEAAFARFCATFPDAFFVSERARVYLDPKKEKENAGRLLSAGFHSMTGYFRDDAPALRADPRRRGPARARRLWQEFDFITGAPMRQYTELHLVRADRLAVHARPRVRLRPRRGQGRDVRGQDQAAGRGLPGEGRAERRRARPRSRRSRTISQIISASIRRVEQDRLGGGAEPRRGPAGRSPSGPTAGRSRRPRARRRRRVLPRRSASRTGWATRTPSATRSSAS